MENRVGKEYTLVRALRDEQINICSMTMGGVQTKHTYQVMLCQKKRFKDAQEPILLVPKVKRPSFKCSVVGNENQRQFVNLFGEDGKSFPLRYVAFPSGYFEVPKEASPAMYDAICAHDSGLFSNWHPDDGPMAYFQMEPGYIQVFRVYEIDRTIHHDCLGKGRTRIFLRSPQRMRVVSPVIADAEFAAILNDLTQAINVADCIRFNEE